MNPDSPNDSEDFWSIITDEWARHKERREAIHEKIKSERLDKAVWKPEFDQEMRVVAQIALKVSLRLKHTKSRDLLWIKDGWNSDDPKLRSFTMWIWRHGVELPDDLAIPMLEQALHEDSKTNFAFVEPVVAVRGRRFVIEWLAPFLENDNVDYSARSAWAIVTALSEYTIGDTSDLEELKWNVKEKFLRRFLNNPPTMLARDLIHLIPLVAENCPSALRPMVAQANQTADRHPDGILRSLYRIRLAEQMKAKNS